MRIFVLMMACVLTATGRADDDWMFPVEIESAHTRDKMKSLTIRETYAELFGTRYAENLSREVQAAVASFEEIVQWYSKRLVVPDLPKKLAVFNKRVATEPDHQTEHVFHSEGDPNKAQTLVTSWFTSHQKQVTSLLPDKNGDVVSISILGMEGKTRIVVMRRDAP